MNNQSLYCTLFNTRIGNFSGFKINIIEANHYLFDLNKKQTIISQQMAIKLKATPKELLNQEMTIEIELNADPISFEKKIDRGEYPSIPQWASVKVAIWPEVKMRIFDLIIGRDAIFKVKATQKMWNQHIEHYKKRKKMSLDI